MEEEAHRIAQGQVPETVPAVVMEKDSTPSSINAIFSPPVFSPPINQFELSQDTSPKLFNPDEFSFDMNSHNDTQNALTPASEPSPIKDKDEPMEASEAPMMPAHDSDSDEGFPVGAEGAPDSEAFNPHDAPTPTAEEVDAALAELDSIPDGVCESGEVEEEEEDEEEWSYFRMEPQTQPQGEDVLLGGITSAAAVPTTEDFIGLPEQSAMVQDQDIVQVPEVPTKDQAGFDEKSEDFIGNLTEKQSKNELLDHFEEEKDLGPSPMEADEAHVVVGKIPDIMQSSMDMLPSLDDHPEKLIKFSEPETEKSNDLMEASFEPSSPHGSGSPPAPGSPRSVEGFVTSVELNTPDESFSTNFTVNQTKDIFAGVVDQTSGPFSVYVSSSPEPASLDPPAQAAVDLLNMSGEMTNGQVDEEHSTINQTPQPCEESPVEIVHAQSTVEVVAPPSPVNVSGPETQFIIPDQVPNSPTSAQLPPTDISFVPQPVMEPMPEIPVPVYVDDTPVSEPDFISGVEQLVNESALGSIVDVADYVDEVALESKMQVDTNVSFSNSELLIESSHLQTSETHTQMESATEVASQVESAAETFSQVESAAETFSQVESAAETFSQVESAAETFSKVESATETFSQVESAAETHTFVESAAETFSHEESAAETVSVMESTIETKQSEMSPTPLSPALSPIEATPISPIIAPVEASPVPTALETEPAVLPSVEIDHVPSSPVEAEVVSAPVNDIPEETLKLVKSPELVDVKTPSKTKKTPAKAATDKAPPKMTPGKTTPSRATPGKATPTRTPSTKTPSTRTPTTRTPITKSTEKKTPIARQTTPASPSKPAAAKPTTKPTTTKPTSARPAAPKLAPTTRPAPTKTSTTRVPLSASRTAEKPTKPAGSTVPKPPSSRPSGPAAKPTTTRPTPAARTSAPATRKPTPTTTTKSTDKADGSKLVNGTTSRPSSRPATGKSTLSTTARKPLASSAPRATAKTAAEKETKNTTNQILSTNRPSKTASPSTRTTATKTSAHSTSRTMSKGIESTNTAKSRLTTSSMKSTAKTTGAATKKTLIKSKTSQAGAKEMAKTKTEAAVIDKTEPLVNGENKIADEETSVEVIEKSAVEDIMQASTEKVITETITSSEQVIVTTETTDVLVNGDH